VAAAPAVEEPWDPVAAGLEALDEHPDTASAVTAASADKALRTCRRMTL